LRSNAKQAIFFNGYSYSHTVACVVGIWHPGM